MRAVRPLQRATAQTITLPVFDADHNVLTPSSAYFSLLDADGTVIIDERACTIASSVAQVSILAGDLPVTMTLGSGWLERWELTIGGVVSLIQREAALSRSIQLQPVTSLDLSSYLPGLTVASWQWYVEEAVNELFSTITDSWRLVSVAGAVPCIRHLAAAMAYEGAGIDYMGQADYQRARYLEARKSWTPKIEQPENTVSASGLRVKVGNSTVYRMG